MGGGVASLSLKRKFNIGSSRKIEVGKSLEGGQLIKV